MSCFCVPAHASVHKCSPDPSFMQVSRRYKPKLSLWNLWSLEASDKIQKWSSENSETWHEACFQIHISPVWAAIEEKTSWFIFINVKLFRLSLNSFIWIRVQPRVRKCSNKAANKGRDREGCCVDGLTPEIAPKSLNLNTSCVKLSTLWMLV